MEKTGQARSREVGNTPDRQGKKLNQNTSAEYQTVDEKMPAGNTDNPDQVEAMDEDDSSAGYSTSTKNKQQGKTPPRSNQRVGFGKTTQHSIPSRNNKGKRANPYNKKKNKKATNATPKAPPGHQETRVTVKFRL